MKQEADNITAQKLQFIIDNTSKANVVRRFETSYWKITQLLNNKIFKECEVDFINKLYNEIVV